MVQGETRKHKAKLGGIKGGIGRYTRRNWEVYKAELGGIQGGTGRYKAKLKGTRRIGRYKANWKILGELGGIQGELGTCTTVHSSFYESIERIVYNDQQY